MTQIPEERSVEIDLGLDLTGPRELRRLVASKLNLSLDVSGSWEELAESLRTRSTGPGTIKLLGLGQLEEMMPQEVRNLISLFAQHNNCTAGAPLRVVLAKDYQPTVYFLEFEARRALESSPLVEGAYVNCWIKDADPWMAERRAIASIEDAGWKPLSLRSCLAVARDDYARDTSALGYLEQAFVDGEVFVFHCWEEEPT